MAQKVMFGEIEYFSDSSVFDSHRYGNLYFDGKDHGIEFFAFVHTDAYDLSVFTPDVQGAQRQAYLDGLLAKAACKRDIGATVQDRLVLLSTCSSASTNGRDILIGRVTDNVFEDAPTAGGAAGPQDAGDQYCSVSEVPPWVPLLLLALAARLAAQALAACYRRARHRGPDKSGKRGQGSGAGPLRY
jgi:sortase B